MQKLEVLIEDNAFGSVRPVEVVADAPVGALVPALVAELKLPQTDLFGKKLVYMLRYAAGGRILPENTTLLACGIEAGARLALDSYVLDGTVAALTQNEQVPISSDPVLHSSATLSDADGLIPVSGSGRNRNTSGNLPFIEKRGRKRSRRAFFMFSGALLGVGTAGAAYAAYHAYTTGTLNLNGLIANGAPRATQVPAQLQATLAPTKAPFPTTAQAVFTFNKHQQAVRTVSWSATGNILASGADDTHVFVWSPNGTVQQDLKHAGAVQAVAWAADGQRLVTGALTAVTFYNATSGATLATHHHTQVVTSLAWTPQNQMQIVSGSQDTHAIVWNDTNYQKQTTFMVHTTPILAVTWSADGQSVASGTQGGVIRVWQSGNTQELHGGYDIKLPVRALAFASSGTQLAAGSDDGMVRIWNGLMCQQTANDTITNQCVDAPQTLQASNKPVRSLAWSPDTRYLAVGTEDGKVTIWYPAQSTQKPIVTAQQNAIVHSLAWSPKGDQLASASGTTVTIWNLM